MRTGRGNSFVKEKRCEEACLCGRLDAVPYCGAPDSVSEEIAKGESTGTQTPEPRKSVCQEKYNLSVVPHWEGCEARGNFTY